MEKLAKNNQYNHYCEKCQGWKLHARGPKYYRCLACNTKTARGTTQVAADNATLPACEHVFIAADNYARCVSCGAPRYR